MTTPAPNLAVPYVEHWALPASTATLTTAQGAVPAGTTQAWPVTVAGPPWPAANPNVRFPDIIRVVEHNATAEIIRVLHTTRVPPVGNAHTWDVMRGDQGTTPIAHPAGAELVNIISAEGLAARAQGVPSGNGLVIPADTTLRPSRINPQPIFGQAGGPHRLTGVFVPAGEAIDGSVYETVAWGFANAPPPPTGQPPATQVRHYCQFGTRWRPTSGTPAPVTIGEATHAVGPGYRLDTNGPHGAGVTRWQIHVEVQITGAGAAAQFTGIVRIWSGDTITANAPATQQALRPSLSGPGPFGGGVPGVLAEPAWFELYCTPQDGVTFITVKGGMAWRAA